MFSQAGVKYLYFVKYYQQQSWKKIDNLRNGLTFKLGKIKPKYFTTARKRNLRLVELLSVNTENIALRICKFCMYLYFARKKVPFLRQV